MKNIAIIPARSGSKGLPNKNIRELNGKPLLSYSIRAAKDSKIFDCVHVSTDSREYAEVACNYGADVPFLRSGETSTDQADSWRVVREVLRKYGEMGKTFDMVTLLQPTSPLRTAQDIRKAYDFFKEKTAEAVVSVCEMEHSPLWSNVLPPDLSMDGFINAEVNRPRQKLAAYYRLNGAIYMVQTSFLRKDSNIYRKGCYAFVMDRDHSVDIDDLIDFKLAEILIGGGTDLGFRKLILELDWAHLAERRCA